MRIGLSTIMSGIALSACAGATGPLPAAFAGTWDLTSAACADQDGVTRLSIAGATLQYYEWGGEVVAARPDGQGSVRVELDWWDTSDTDANDRPTTRRLPGRLTLLQDQSMLEVDIDGDLTTYSRCP